SWDVGVVDLRKVLSFQWSVILDRVDERLGGVNQENWNELFSVCLPIPTPVDRFRFLTYPEDRAFTISSTNPNLRLLAPVSGDATVAPNPNALPRTVPMFGFGIDFGAPFVQIMDFHGRWFVRDGYHRCYGLLKRGVFRIPCVFIRTSEFRETGA